MHDDEVTSEMAEVYMRNFSAFREAMRKEFPEALLVIGVDYGSEPDATAVQHKCARCDMVLEVQLLANGAERAELDAALAAHQERCFRVGDRVRWEPHKGGMWVEGTLVMVEGSTLGLTVERMNGGADRLGWAVGRTGGTVAVNCRRIPRPEQKVDTLPRDARCNHVMFDGAPIADVRPSMDGSPVGWCVACVKALDENSHRMAGDAVRAAQAKFEAENPRPTLTVGSSLNAETMDFAAPPPVQPGVLAVRDAMYKRAIDHLAAPMPKVDGARQATHHCVGMIYGKQCRETTPAGLFAAPWRCPEHDGCVTFVGTGAWCSFCMRKPAEHRIVTPWLKVPPDVAAPTFSEAFKIRRTAHGDMLEDVYRQPDPLDVPYDGVTLRDLLVVDEARRREQDIGVIPWRNTDPWTWTAAQHAAISAHHSAQLRAKIAASKQAERNRVVVDLQDNEENPW